MSKITFSAEVTEYDITPAKVNTENKFYINEKSLIITLCDTDGLILDKSEISIEDAKILARLILF